MREKSRASNENDQSLLIAADFCDECLSIVEIAISLLQKNKHAEAEFYLMRAYPALRSGALKIKELSEVCTELKAIQRRN